MERKRHPGPTVQVARSPPPFALLNAGYSSPPPRLPPAARHRHDDGAARAVLAHELGVALAHEPWTRKVTFGGRRIRHRRGAIGTARRHPDAGTSLREGGKIRARKAALAGGLGRSRVRAAGPAQAAGT